MTDEVEFAVGKLWRAIGYEADHCTPYAQRIEAWEKQHYRTCNFPDSTAARLIRYFFEAKGWSANQTAEHSVADLLVLLGGEADANAKPGNIAKRDSKTEARDKWIYEKCCRLTPYKTIVVQLSRQRKAWDRIESVPGIKRAAKAYAIRHNLELPPARKSGRKAR